jgi:glucose/arabinose dehydrogenase
MISNIDLIIQILIPILIVGRDIISSIMFYLFVGIVAIVIILIPIIAHSTNAASASPLVYGCIPQGQVVRCHPSLNEFESLMTTGRVQKVSTVNLTRIDPIEGVFGNSLAVNGYRQEYFTLPNNPAINSKIFSVSFWLKQDSAYVANSAAIISHLNAKKTAGWYFQLNVTKSQTTIQFSVTNSDGKIFTVSSPFEIGVFQNVVGTFDEKELKIYVNGYLINRNNFNGSYNANPDVSLNVGLNSYDYGGPWTGLMDELRFYDRVISEIEVQKLADYSTYSRYFRASNDDGLSGYWPFDQGLMDKSGNGNDGKIIPLAVSMVFSPDGKLFYSVRDAGEIKIAKPIPTVLIEPFVRLQDPVTDAHQEILGITLDPNFAVNHFVYAYVVVKDGNTGNVFSRVMRFIESENRATDQKILIDNIPARNVPLLAGGLVFGPDDKLYVSTGYFAQIEQGQNSNLTGKVLRINRDGTIPVDNPFPNSPVYSEGHRSMYGIAFDYNSQMGIVAENDARNFDEVNLLKKGGSYGFLGQSLPSSSTSYGLQTDNVSAIKPARSYFPPITPAQAIFYDENKFPALKGKFLIVSYGERSIYAIGLNGNGSISEELVIRLPETRGHLVAIAQSPEGDIYIGGENVYKLQSIERNRNKLTYFINVLGTKNIEVADLIVNLTTKVLSMDILYKNNGSLASTEQIPQTLQIKIPKAVLGTIYVVTSEKYNQSSTGPDKIVDSFKLKETMRVTNVGNTIIDIKLNPNIVDEHTDKILIKGLSSLLAPAPSRTISILR